MSEPQGHYEHRNPECTWHDYTEDRGLKRPLGCTCAKRHWWNPPPVVTRSAARTGKITAMASTERPGQVEIIMSDGEDAAVTYMRPDQALKFCMDVMAAANQATR